jgi:glycosyltransferase involved in cell wall biosynthesis
VRVLALTYSVVGHSNFARCGPLASALAGRGHEVTIAAARRHPGPVRRTTRVDGVTLVETADVLPWRARNSGLSPFDIADRLLFALTGRWDVVHAFGHRPAVTLPARVLRERTGAPVVADWADLWGRGAIAGERALLPRLVLGGLDHIAERWACRTASAVTVASTALHRLALELGAAPARALVVPAGASVDRIRPLPVAAMRGRFGLDLEARILVHAGAGCYDVELLARSFVVVARHEPRALLLLIGGRPRGLGRLLRQEGLAHRVVALGHLPYEHLGAALACGDVMLLPFRDRPINRGRSPGKLGDYAAAGRPVVTNPTGDVGTLVAAEGIGVLAGESPEVFARAILDLLADPQRRRALGERAREVAERRLAWSVLAADVEALYASARG